MRKKSPIPCLGVPGVADFIHVESNATLESLAPSFENTLGIGLTFRMASTFNDCEFHGTGAPTCICTVVLPTWIWDRSLDDPAVLLTEFVSSAFLVGRTRIPVTWLQS